MTERPFRVLVTGSRDWEEISRVWAALNEIRFEAWASGRALTVVHGACPTGADEHASAWCRTATQVVPIAEERHPANWRQHGRTAGPIRNQHMVNLGADLVLAFIRNGSRGASHTTALAEAAGIPVRRYTN